MSSSISQNYPMPVQGGEHLPCIEIELQNSTAHMTSFCRRLSSFLSLVAAFSVTGSNDGRAEWPEWQKCFRNARLGSPAWNTASQGSQSSNEECDDERLASHLSDLLGQMLRDKGYGFFTRMYALLIFRCISFLLNTATLNIGSYSREYINRCLALESDSGAGKRFESLSAIAGILIKVIGKHFSTMKRAGIEPCPKDAWDEPKYNLKLAKIAEEGRMNWEKSCELCYNKVHQFIKEVRIFDFTSTISSALTPPSRGVYGAGSLLTLCAAWLQYCFTAPLLAVAYLAAKLVQDWIVNPIARLITLYTFKKCNLIDRMLNLAFDAVRTSPIPEPGLSLRFPTGWDHFLIFIWEHIENLCQQQIDSEHDPSKLQMLERRATVSRLPYEEMHQELINTVTITLELMLKEAAWSVQAVARDRLKQLFNNWASDLLSSQLAYFLAYMAQRPGHIAEITSNCWRALANAFSVSADIPQSEAEDLHSQQKQKRLEMLCKVSEVISYITSQEGQNETDRRLALEVCRLLASYQAVPVKTQVDCRVTSRQELQAIQQNMERWITLTARLCLDPYSNSLYKNTWRSLELFKAELTSAHHLLQALTLFIHHPKIQPGKTTEERIINPALCRIKYLEEAMQTAGSRLNNNKSMWWCNLQQRAQWREQLEIITTQLTSRAKMWRRAIDASNNLVETHKQLETRKAKISAASKSYQARRNAGLTRELLAAEETGILKELKNSGISHRLEHRPETVELVTQINQDPLMTLDQLQSLIDIHFESLIPAAQEAQRRHHLQFILVPLMGFILEFQMAHQLIQATAEELQNRTPHVKFGAIHNWETYSLAISALSTQVQASSNCEEISEVQAQALLDGLTKVSKLVLQERSPILHGDRDVWSHILALCSALCAHSPIGMSINEINQPLNLLLDSLHQRSSNPRIAQPIGTGPISECVIGACKLLWDGLWAIVYYQLDIKGVLNTTIDKYVLAPATFTNLLRTGVYLAADTD